MTTLTQRRPPTSMILSEAPGHRSRENATITESQDFAAGQVLGRIAATTGVTVTSAADAGNTASSGALTLASPAYTSAAIAGRYTVVCIEPATNGGTFRVEDPNGQEVGTAKVGVAFAKQVKFTIADSTGDFAAGDKFTVDVEIATGGELFKAWNEDATDGSQVPAAVALYPATTGAGETARIAVLRRDAEVNGKEIDWSDTATADELVTAIARLADDTGIIVR